MNDQQRMLSDMVGGLFSSFGPESDTASNWSAVQDLELPSLLLAEEDGGFSGTWADAFVVFRLAGYHAVAMPIAEAVVATALASGSGLSGRGTIAAASTGTVDKGRFTGTVSGAVDSADAAFIAAPAAGDTTMVLNTQGARHESRSNPAGQARETWHFDGADVHPVSRDLFELGAFVKVAQSAGALDAALAMTVGYANERVQFGRSLANFQAVQQSLATFACEAAAANCAARGFAAALDRGDARYECAAAKLRTNIAIGVGTAIAHQVHGAIGFTHEYGLAALTQKLWSARSEFGGDSHWAGNLGEVVLQAGAGRYWSDLVELSDPPKQPIRSSSRP